MTHIDAGDAPTWAGVIVAVGVAGWSSWKARAAEKRADAALAESKRQSAALERMALALEAHRSTGSKAPAVQWTIEPTSVKGNWRLRNEGSETAHGVAIVNLPEGIVTRRIPTGDIDLVPFQSVEFIMESAGWGSNMPGELHVATSDQGGPTVVPLPH